MNVLEPLRATLVFTCYDENKKNGCFEQKAKQIYRILIARW